MQDSVGVRISLPVGGFTVRFDSLESFPPGSRFFLKDTRRIAGRDSVQDLLVNNQYTFSYTGIPYRTDLRRFKIIVFPPLVGVKDDLPGSGVSAPLDALLFPNPAKESLTVKLMNGRGTSEYRIASVTGQVVMTGKAQCSQFSLNVHNLPKGMYLLQVTEGQRTVTRRFVKE